MRRDGYQLGVVSNFDYRLYHILEGLGLSEAFDSITISSEAGWAKPDPRIFEVALTRHGVTAGEALHVGDVPQLDAAGAQAAGIAAVLIDPEAAAARVTNGRVVTIKSLRGVIDAIRQLALV